MNSTAQQNWEKYQSCIYLAIKRELSHCLSLFNLNNIFYVPSITFENHTHTLGSFDPNTQTLSLSLKLILEQPWENVRQVLHHEASHMIVHYQKRQEAPHGPHFQHICQILGVHPLFRKSHINLDSFHEEKNQTESSILQRIQKLLALAESSNIHEAESAMQKAQALIEKYNIEVIKELNETNYIEKIINLKKLRIERYQWDIADILKKFYFVSVLGSRTVDLFSEKINYYDADYELCFRCFKLYGSEENVKMAEYVYTFLEYKITELWLQFKEKKNKKGVQNKNSYFLGLLRGFKEKLEEEQKKREHERNLEDKTALVRLTHKHNELATQWEGKVSYVTHKSVIKSSTYHAGIEDGKKIVIHKPITSQTKKGLFLE